MVSSWVLLLVAPGRVDVSVLEVEDDLVLADETDGFGVELPLGQGADDLAGEDAVARLPDLDVGDGPARGDVHPGDDAAGDTAADRLARERRMDAVARLVLLADERLRRGGHGTRDRRRAGRRLHRRHRGDGRRRRDLRDLDVD